jgi:aminoglycoside phosphotransferase family enzyme
VSTRRKVAFLRRADSYPEVTAGDVQVIETHFAWIFLTASHAYKMKKPERHVWDYESLDIRELGCRTELRLNRRLAPSVYLDVVPLSCSAGGRLVLGKAERVVDWVIKMRRLPAERALDVALRRAGNVSACEQSGLIELLAHFYRRASRQPLTSSGYLRSVRARIARNAADLGAPDLRVNSMWLNQIVSTQQQFVREHESLLGERASHLVEGHGDLRPEHIFLDSPDGVPCVIDCLEFDAHLRRLDPAEELAFLMLECKRLGAHELADQLGAGVMAALSDVVPAELVHFYMSCQALNRAKVAAWHLRDLRGARRVRHWQSRTESYLSDADHYARWAVQSAGNRSASAPGLKSAVRCAPDVYPTC